MTEPTEPIEYPCDHCGELVPVDQCCGDDENYLCADCFGAALSTTGNEQ